jgi:thioredoxin-dependent peroxiredoxin
MDAYTNIRAGDRAPRFILPDDTGTPVSLASLRGQRVVLYFYPKDDTPGCTVEACEFRDLLPRFSAQGVAVFGISPDPVRKHARFKAKHGLSFPLLADEDHAVCEAYGVWREKLFWGRKYMGVMRTTYVIDAEGRIEHIWEHVEHEGHAAEVDAWLRGEAPPPRTKTVKAKAKTSSPSAPKSKSAAKPKPKPTLKAKSQPTGATRAAKKK